MRNQKRYETPEIEVTRFGVDIPIMDDNPGDLIPIPGEDPESDDIGNLGEEDETWTWNWGN